MSVDGNVLNFWYFISDTTAVPMDNVKRRAMLYLFTSEGVSLVVRRTRDEETEREEGTMRKRREGCKAEVGDST